MSVQEVFERQKYLEVTLELYREKIEAFEKELKE